MIRTPLTTETHNFLVSLCHNDKGCREFIHYIEPKSSYYEGVIDEVVSELNEKYNAVKDFVLMEESSYYRDGERTCFATITGHVVREDSYGTPFIALVEAFVEASPKRGNEEG